MSFEPTPDIALVAAVPAETGLIRESLTPIASPVAGASCWRGRLGGAQVVLTHCGIGKANAAARTALLLERYAPRRVLHFGCAGAYPGTGLRPGDLALAGEEIFGDEGSQTPDGFLGLDALQLPLVDNGQVQLFQRIPLDPRGADLSPPLEAFAAAAGIRFARGPFVTVSTCAGTNALARELATRTGGLCESMEGAAVALACLLHGIPCVELRGISNLAEDRDPGRWDLPAGCRIAQQALRHLLEQVPEIFA